MISYAQNFEDVMLWRALRDVSNGFYIDVGAWSPDIDSVTRHFYERGWRGINIEPNPTFSNQYKEKRPEDVTLEVAISDIAGTAKLYFSSNPGLSSLDATIAMNHEAEGTTTTPQVVEVTTLKDVCAKYVQGKEIHFLKVDVEGFEKNVLASNDWLNYRPWIIVVEATKPMSQIENYTGWEPLLFEASYEFAYADGLNRFYVAKEHQELKSAFKYPPNVFDEFVLAQEVKLRKDVEKLMHEAEKLVLETEKSLKESLVQIHTTRQMYENSLSWKLTKPLRHVKKLFFRGD